MATPSIDEGSDDGGDVLSAEEDDIVNQFLSHINCWRQNRGFCRSLSRSSAIKFLMARKFDLDRALILYQQHELMRIREGLHISPDDVSELERELKTGKFTILPTRDDNGATLALFHAHKHDPSIVTQKTTLQGLIFQLDVALEDIRTQRAGLVFIYNMSGSKYSNFDYELSQKILTLLKGSYPARLKKVLIVMAPFWFKAPFKVLRLFVREKLRDRVFTVSLPQLVSHIPSEAIPKELGGQLCSDHSYWLSQCEKMKGELVKCQNENFSHSEENTILSEGKEKHEISEEYIENISLSDESESHDEEKIDNNLIHGMDLKDFIKHVKAKGRRGLYHEYSELKARPFSGTFDSSRQLINHSKNRYTDVLSYDHSRVKLLSNVEDSDYINANYVDGYKQSKAFISTQGPLEKTFLAFWQMIWEQRVYLIVMTTKTIESHRTKCGQYWPNDVGAKTLINGAYEIICVGIDNHTDFIITHLSLKNLYSNKERFLFHFQFVSWPDYGVPQNAHSMLHFLSVVRDKQFEMTGKAIEKNEWSGHSLGPPIVVHCSAGIGRSGTFVTLDVAIQKFENIGKVDIRSTVEKIRSQRASSIQTPEQYVFCHLAFLEYVVSLSYVTDIDLSGFDDDIDSE